MSRTAFTPAQGRIAIVSRGRDSCVVTLNEPQDGHEYVRIDTQTRGVRLLLKEGGGEFIENTYLWVARAVRIPEGWRALDVSGSVPG